MTIRPGTDSGRTTRRCGRTPFRARGIALLLLMSSALCACLPDAVPWAPTEEDTGVDSGPDPGTCEHRGDCGPVVK